jgi:hypothetical protein
MTPVGSRFKVVASALEKPGPDIPGRPPALDGSDWVGAIVVPFGADEDVGKLAASQFHYYCPFNPSPIERPKRDRYFELRKDLARLEHATSERAARDILLRLAECGDVSGTSVSSIGKVGQFDALVARYVKQPRYLEAIRRTRERQSYNGTWLLQKGPLDELEVRLAKAGYVPAQFGLALHILNPLHEPRNEAEFIRLWNDGTRWLKRASDAGFLAASYELAELYRTVAEDDSDVTAPLRTPQRARDAEALLAKVNRALEGAEQKADPKLLFVLAYMADRGGGMLGRHGSERVPSEAKRLGCLVTARVEARGAPPSFEEAQLMQRCSTY